MTIEQDTIADSEVGSSCPYCRFPLKAGVAASKCPECGASHHGDCWSENGGCAVVGCVAGPSEVTQSIPMVGASASGALPVSAGKGAPPPAPVPQANSSSNRGLTYAVLFLALAIAGAGVAVLVNNSGSDSTGSAAVSSVPDGVSVDSTTTLADRDDPHLRQQAIESLIKDFHERVQQGDYSGAWNLLSTRKQDQAQREYGYSTWVQNQKTLRPYIDPSGTTVTVEDFNPTTGEARIDVQGMGWSKPGATCSYWSGLTWVIYEDGVWKYDPGYSTTSERRSRWSDRGSELLGGTCGS